MKTKRYCAECGHFNPEEMICTDEKGKFYNIKITEEVAEANNDCTEFKEATYRLSPKGCLLYAIRQNKVRISQAMFDKVWAEFESAMRASGYVKDDEN